MSHNHRTLILGLGLSALVFALMQLSTMFPRPVPADAPANEFSAGRAIVILEELLAENVPHTVGTPENRRVRDRILRHLEELGLEVQQQDTIGCHSRGTRCAFVENVMARVPGQNDGEAVLLMSHYDSVPMAPGAGDDGGGVAAMLEIARIINSEAPLRNPVIFLFTDAEEVGLLGAEAFFGQHPWAKEVGVVLNIEGSGSEGESLLLRTGPGSGWVVDAFRDSVSHPSAASIADEVFRHMPNDTDFSVSMRAGLPGVDFAFATERNHYHTPLDTVENLSRVTLQHHGENLLPLTRKLADMDLSAQEESALLYQSIAQLGTIAWSQKATAYLVVLGFLLWGTAAVLAARNAGTKVGRMIIGMVTALAVIVLVLVLNFGVYEGFRALGHQYVPWPAHDWPYLLMLGATTALALLLVTWGLGRFLDGWSALIGAAFIYLGISMIMATAAPLAANLFLIPSLAIAVAMMAFAVGSAPDRSGGRAAIAALAITTIFTLPSGLLFIQTQGYRLAFSAWPFVAIYAMTVLPLLVAAQTRALKPILASLAVLLLALLAATWVSPYSEHRPQHLNLIHIEDADNDVAHWLVWSPGPVPDRLMDIMPFEDNREPVYPWTESNPLPVAPGDTEGSEAPQVEVLGSTRNGDGRHLNLRVVSQRGSRRLRLMVPVATGLKSVQVEGHEAVIRQPEDDEEWIRIFIEGVPDQGVELALQLEPGDEAEWYVYDWKTELPESGQALFNARPPLAAPVHSGDQSVVFRRVSL